MESIRLGEKIGSGGFRDCYEVVSNPLVCGKVIRANRYSGLGISWPMAWTSLERFGRVDLNSFEIEILGRLPDALKEHAVQNAHMAEVDDGRMALVADRVRNYDGTYAETLETVGSIANHSFWEHMNRLVGVMKESDMHLFGINSKNVMVQKVSAMEWRPVFVDVKHAGSRGGPIRRMFGGGRDKQQRDTKLDVRYASLRTEFGTATELPNLTGSNFSAVSLQAQGT